MVVVPSVEAPSNGESAARAASTADVAELQAFLSRARHEPRETIAELVRTRREAREHCQRAAEMAARLNQVITELTEPPHILGYLERLRADQGQQPRAVVRVHGQLRELAVHPSVDLATLEGLSPWDQVRIHPKEMVVVGARRDSALNPACYGDVVEFKSYFDRTRGMAFVSRGGHGEEVIALAPSICEESLTTGALLVLHRDNPRWAIDRLPAERVETHYETPIADITTRLDDIAGVGPVLEPLLEDVLLRVIYPEHREAFDLKPLNGLILYSHKAGMGKTALVRGLARFLHDMGKQADFDVILNCVKPNEFKSVYHGQDAANVRQFAASLRARLAQPRDRRLVVLIVFDECDSLGSRSYRGEQWVSPAQNDCVQALLAEMDGLVQLTAGEGPPVDLLWIGLTNAPDGVDHALKRPGRFGDLFLQMPDYTREAAEGILWVHARRAGVPWWIDDEIRENLSEDDVRQRILQPALERVFSTKVLRYGTEGQRRVEVSAGQVMSGAHYANAMNNAKRRAAVRRLRGAGVSAIGVDDVVAALFEVSREAAAQLVADPQMLVRTLQIKTPVVQPELTPDDEPRQQQYRRS